MHFKLSLTAILSLALIAFAATVTQVKPDLTVIGNGVKKLDTDVKALNSANLMQAQVIRQDAENLKEATKTATADAKSAPPFSPSDASEILDKVDGAEIPTALGDLVNRKKYFDQTGVTAIVESELSTLKGEVVKLADVLIGKITSDDLKKRATRVKEKIVTAFNEAIKAFET